MQYPQLDKPKSSWHSDRWIRKTDDCLIFNQYQGNILTHRCFLFSHCPRNTSESPWVSALGGTGYISALSKKLIPASEAWSRSVWLSARFSNSPNCMVPAEQDTRVGDLYSDLEDLYSIQCNQWSIRPWAVHSRTIQARMITFCVWCLCSNAWPCLLTTFLKVRKRESRVTGESCSSCSGRLQVATCHNGHLVGMGHGIRHTLFKCRSPMQFWQFCP